MGMNIKNPEVHAMARERAADVTQATGELVIDTSAVMAMLLQESDAETFIDAAVRASVDELLLALRGWRR